MAHIQYMPGDPRLVDQLVYELKSKGIFDQFRKDCIADVDTRPAYQNLRQRVENSVSTFLSRQTWQPDLNKNQLREKLRKHILDGNYLEQGVERIVDQVVNPKVASVFIPKVEDLVYNYLGIARKKSVTAETSNVKVDDLLPNDLEAVSPGSVKSNEPDTMEDEMIENNKMDVDEKSTDFKNDTSNIVQDEKADTPLLTPNVELNADDKSNIPLPLEEIKPENIPSPENSPPKIELEKIELPKEPIISTDIPLPDDIVKDEKDQFFKTINSEDDDTSSDSSLRRNMSPLTPIRNFNNENSCDAQQAFENKATDSKGDNMKEPSSFRFAIEAKSPENISDPVKTEKKDNETALAYQFNNQVNINNFNTPLYEDSSNSNNLHIDYESDANSKVNQENKTVDTDQNSEDSKKEQKSEERKSSSHKSSHRSRESHKHSSSKDKKPDTKHSSSRDSSRHDKSKSSRDDNKSKSSDKERSRDRSDKKDSRDSSKHRSSHKSSHKDSKSYRSSSSSHRHSSKHSDEKKSSSSSSNKDKSSDKNSDKRKDSKSSHRSDKDRKSSSSSSKSDKSSIKNKQEDKDKDKKKKETDDHYSLSGRGNRNRRSTDRDSNDGSSSSKGSTHPSSSKTSETKKESKTSSKSETTSTSGDSTNPSDKENIVYDHGSKTRETLQHKPIVRIESHLELPISSPPRLPFVPDITIKKPKFAANLQEAKRLMKMRKFLDEEQKRMNQEAALLLEFQANVRPSLSQVYSSIPGPELEFACVTSSGQKRELVVQSNENEAHKSVQETFQNSHYTSNQLLNVLNDASVVIESNSMNNEQGVVKGDITNDNKEQINNDYESAKLEDNSKIHSHENISNENNEIKDKFSVEQKGVPDKIDFTSCTDNGITKENEDILVVNNNSERFKITVTAETLSEREEIQDNVDKQDNNNKGEVIIRKSSQQHNNNKEQLTIEKPDEPDIPDENKFHYFAEHEKFNSEIERAKFTEFFKEYKMKVSMSDKLYLINCDSYEENIIRDVSKNFGDFEIVSYHKNGHLKLPKTKNVIKNVNISNEISLPIDNDYENNDYEGMRTHIFSPEKSECSFELSSDYDAKLEEMVNRTSRREIMEIILGNIGESPNKMPRIDYLTDSNIDSEYEYNMKRKISNVETTVNNNRNVLTPNKIRKLSTEQITSTTEESIEDSDNNIVNNTRSKYLGKARRVGLPRPKRSIIPNSPSSDKSVENYEQNSQTTPQSPNGKIKRAKIQRYDTSDLYKPKLHFLSRRNHIT